LGGISIVIVMALLSLGHILLPGKVQNTTVCHLHLFNVAIVSVQCRLLFSP
jgi:hypothetical protein